METSSSIKWIARLLGAIWIFDGILQFQPGMFGQTFVTNVLAPVAQGQPAFMAAIVNWGIALWNTNTMVTDTLAGLLQVAIGVLILFPLRSKVSKAGLWISVVWSVIVWLCGEGAGLLLTGNASFYTGAPGAVVIYAIIAILLLWQIDARLYPKVAGWLMVLGAALQLQPSLWSSDGAMANFMPAMNDPVGPFASLPNYLSNLTGLAPVEANIILAALLLVVGILLILKPNKTTGIIALVFLFIVWWLGQDFGQLSVVWTGTPTDPNTAPLVALLLIPLLMRSSSASVPVSTTIA